MSITDPTGATVPGAKVTVTETHTGTKIPAVSDNSGQYTAPFLLPGEYDIAVQSPGFKEALRKGVHVGAGDHPVIDFRLDVGDVSAVRGSHRRRAPSRYPRTPPLGRP